MDFDFEVDFDIEDFAETAGAEKLSSRIYKPKQPKKTVAAKYSHAKKMAAQIDLNDRHYCIVDGKFIFGDLIEALIIEKELRVKYMFISSLSISQENIDSLCGMLHHDEVIDQLDLIVSNYFFSHEKWKLIPYMYKVLDHGDKFQLGVARTHTKICLFETYCGKFITIHGSANMRSSENYEQIMIENDRGIYDFNKEFHEQLIQEYSTIKKTQNGKN